MYVVSGMVFPDALSICCTSFTTAASTTGLHLFKCFPTLMKSLSYSMNGGVRLEEEENQNQGRNDGSGKVFTKGRIWEENDVEELSEHNLIDVLSSMNSCSKYKCPNKKNKNNAASL
jgi:hypothetical protein